jgi:hypothetical protein
VIGVEMDTLLNDKNSNYPNFTLTQYVGAKAQGNAPTSIDSLNYRQQAILIKVALTTMPFFL